MSFPVRALCFCALSLAFVSASLASHAAAPSQPGLFFWDAPAAYHARTTRSPKRGALQKIVALTFDDGPSASITPQILATLRQNGIHATFFVLGRQIALYPNLLKQIVAEGHAIGIHTYSHAMHPTARSAATEMAECERLLRAVTGHETRLFRSPYGNTRSAFTREALHRGYANILWSKTGADTGTRDAQVVRDNVTRSVRPGDIVLMHDAADKQHTAKALPEIVQRLHKAGYRFVTVPEMLAQWDQAAALPPAHHPMRRESKAPPSGNEHSRKAEHRTTVNAHSGHS